MFPGAALERGVPCAMAEGSLWRPCVPHSAGNLDRSHWFLGGKHTSTNGGGIKGVLLILMCAFCGL